MKKRISPATIIASVALFFSLGTGAGIAAQHYLITSLSQIGPKVRHELRGERGPRGRTGQGVRGIPGTAAANPTISTYIASNSATVPNDGSTVSVEAACNPGDHITGGGGGSKGSKATIAGSAPVIDGSTQAWQILASVPSTSSQTTVTVLAVCATG